MLIHMARLVQIHQHFLYGIDLKKCKINSSWTDYTLKIKAACSGICRICVISQKLLIFITTAIEPQILHKDILFCS
jgi:hypothetical protein